MKLIIVNLHLNLKFHYNQINFIAVPTPWVHSAKMLLHRMSAMFMKIKGWKKLFINEMLHKFQIKIQSNPRNCQLFQRTRHKSKQFLQRMQMKFSWVKRVQATRNRKKISVRAVGPTTITQTWSLQLMWISRYQLFHTIN